MKKFFVDILLVSFPVLGFMSSVCIIGDPAHKFDESYEVRINEYLASDKIVTNVDNCSERKLKKLFIRTNANKHYDWAVFSSSRGMTISSAETGSQLINLGVSGATVKDFLALDFLCSKSNLTYTNLIVVIDAYMLYHDKQDARWHECESVFNEAMNYPCEIEYESKWGNLFSPTYFQSSLKLLLSGKSVLTSSETIDNPGLTICPDGSIAYPEKTRNKPQNEIDKHTEMNTSEVCHQFKYLSSELKNLFITFVNINKKKGVNAVFYIAPLHPILYSKIKDIQGVNLQLKFLANFLSENDYPLIGSLNPYEVGCDNTGFYDLVHMRREIINKYVREEIIEKKK